MKKIIKVSRMIGVASIGLMLVSQVMAIPLTNESPVQKLVSPIRQQANLLAPFGQDRGSYMHQGVDIAAELGTPLYAVADGIVTKAAPDSKGVDAGGGHMVFIDHGDGTESWYMHLDRYAVKAGDRVKAGDIIGFSGVSGDATAPLLHFEYRICGQPVDPYFIFQNFTVLESVIDSFMVIQQ